ncbi:MAG TPA: amidohydrolase family protein [Gemmatimonadaceae bacterium]|nr:amidohydrolase family protein [Gemmatimonadaceae bacterium]
MITLIENGEVYAPAPRGRQSVLVINGVIEQVGEVDRRALEALRLPLEVVDASGCVVCPGLIDPHEHILGGSGEHGFASMTPEIFVEELVAAGVTTVVGCLGVDVTLRNMSALVGKAKALREEGVDCFLWTGGYRVPPVSLTPSVRDDILFIEEVIGVGEVAIADERSTDPDAHELAKVVHEAYVGGMLARKCGLTHFHVGEERQRLAPLRELIERYSVEPGWLYATHVERNEPLMREALALAREGVHIDVDVVAQDLPKWLRFYVDHGGDPERLTISSDASIASPGTLLGQLRSAVREHRFPLELVLPMLTANTARVLRLGRQGTLEPGKAGDLLLLDGRSLEVADVHCRGGWMMRGGSLVKRSRWLEGNKRQLNLKGTDVGGDAHARGTES